MTRLQRNQHSMLGAVRSFGNGSIIRFSLIKLCAALRNASLRQERICCRNFIGRNRLIGMSGLFENFVTIRADNPSWRAVFEVYAGSTPARREVLPRVT